MSPIIGTIDSAKTGNLSFLAYDAIASTVISNSTTTTINFNSIPQTYKHLQIRGLSQGTYTAYNITTYINFSGDTGGNYSFHEVVADGSALSTVYDTRTALWIRGNNPGTYYSNAWATVIMDILDYTNTNKTKTIRTMSGWHAFAGGAAGQITMNGGLWNSTSAITSISLQIATDYWKPNTRYALYGIKA
jgi:hypothetical protein